MSIFIYDSEDSSRLYSITSKLINSESEEVVLKYMLKWDKFVCHIVDVLDTWKDLRLNNEYTSIDIKWFKHLCIFNILCLKHEIFLRFKNKFKVNSQISLTYLENKNKLRNLSQFCASKPEFFSKFINEESDFFTFFISYFQNKNIDILTLKNFMEAYLDVKMVSNIILLHFVSM